jgi:hypothetical protein
VLEVRGVSLRATRAVGMAKSLSCDKPYQDHNRMSKPCSDASRRSIDVIGGGNQLFINWSCLLGTRVGMRGTTYRESRRSSSFSRALDSGYHPRYALLYHPQRHCTSNTQLQRYAAHIRQTAVHIAVRP